MRKKVRKSLAFLLALALVVSVMSGLGLSVSADDAQNEPVVTETEGEPAEEKPKVEESTPKEGEEEEEADPDAEAVPEEKKDEQKAEGEGSGAKTAEKQDETTPKAGENVQTATIGTGDKTVTVKTTAAAGVLPEGAKLVVKKLANQDQAYQDAESTLKDSQVTYDDFLALDVGFEVNGKEVEPEAGSVQVQFELGAGLLPETADTSTLAVQHLTDGKAETVADAGAVTAGDVTVKNEVVKADFEVKSFSTFTITWGISGNSSAEIKLYAATRADNASGFAELFGQDSVGSINNTQGQNEYTIPLGNDVTYGGKTYKATGKAYILYNGEYAEVTSLKKKSFLGDRRRTYYIIYASGTGLPEPNSTDAENVVWYGYKLYWYDDSDDLYYGTATDNKVYLEYNTTSDSGSTGGVTTNVDSLAHRKFIKKKDDGTYDLTLTVAGAAGSTTNKKKLDVLLIVDKSGSMQYNMKGTNKNDRNPNYAGSRWEASKKAIQEMITSLNANSANLDTKYSIVTFSGDKYEESWKDKAWGDAKLELDWSYSSEFVISTDNSWSKGNGILDFQPSGGTNYQAGFREGKEQLKLARKDAQKVVIFLSDGEATYYYNENGITAGDGNADCDGYDWYGDKQNAGSCSDAAMKEAAGITSANYFYTIGLGDKDAINSVVLTNLSKTVAEKSPGCIVNTDNKPFMCDSLEGLKNAFAKMYADITTFTCTNVKVTDQLSNNVNIVKAGTATDNPYNFRISMTNKDGTPGNVPEGTTAKYNEETKQVELKFPEKYELEDGATYQVTFTVEPSDLAYQKYAESGGEYTETGEEDTGDTAGQKGYFSNDWAKVEYTYKEEPRSEPYKKPVVQVNAATITVTKTVTGDLSKDVANAKEFKFTIDSGKKIPDNMYTSYLKKGSTGTVEGNTLTLKNGQSATFVYKAGTHFKFTEDQDAAKVDNFDLTVTGGTSEGDMTTSGTKLTVTNDYKKATANLTITKAVQDDSEDSDPDVSREKYTFTITPANGVTVEDGSYGNATFKGGVGTVTITGAKSVVIPDLPLGEYTVTESEPAGRVDKFTWRKSESTMTGKAELEADKDGSVTITNKYRKDVTVTVVKKVTGNMCDPKNKFKFKVNGGADQTRTAETGKNTIATDVAYGSEFTVTETDKNGYVLKEITAKGSTGSQKDDSYTINSVTEDTEITFTNDKTINPPNGIITTIAPYAIMVVLAAGAGVYFVYSRRRRNR